MKQKREKSVSFLAARAGVLTIGKTAIETPVRVLTSTDLHNADVVMRATHDEISIPFPHKLYQVKMGCNEERLNVLGKYKKFCKTAIKRTEGLIKKTTAPVSWFEASIGQGIPISSAENAALLDIGLQAGADVNTIYDSPDLTIARFEKRLQASLKLTEKCSTCKGVVVRMPTSQSRVAIDAKMRLAMEYTDGVDLKYADPKYVHAKYLTASEIAKEYGKFFGLTDVPKTWNGNGRTSMMHIEQLYGFDAFSLKLGRYFEPERIPPQKRFDRATLAHLVIPQEHTPYYGDNPACFSQCPIDRHYHTLPELLRDLSPNEQTAAFRVHEAFDSQADFALKREAILSGEKALLDQFRGQKYAQQAIKDVFGVDIAEPKLPDYF